MPTSETQIPDCCHFKQLQPRLDAPRFSRFNPGMRIISGTAANVILKVPKGYDVRPTPDLVRQAIFNMIQNQAGTVNCLPKTARWLDLFAGEHCVGCAAGAG